MKIERITCALLGVLLLAPVCRAQQAATGSTTFSFTKVDLDLLDKSNQLDKQFRDRGLVFDDSETTRYITKVGQAVLPAGPELQNVHWQFLVLRDPTPNAFALPNGSVYVHSGLLAVIQNEAELAGVLAHEETHVLDRHSYLEYRSARKKSEAAILIAGAGSIGGFTAGGIAGGASWVLGATIPAFIGLTITGYSRELEQEADVRAVHALVDANYSSREMKDLFDALQQEHDVDLSTKSFYQDHPKLKDRTRYVSDLSASPQPSDKGAMVEADRYLIETETAVRHDAELEIRAGRARTAAWAMEQIVKRDDKLADNFYVLGEAYRGLGPRTPQPQPNELTDKGKDQARKMISKMTSQEYGAALLKAPGGEQTLESNQQLAEKNYKRALEMSPDLAGAHRGLGFLYEDERKPELSVQEFRKYLELAPSAVDAPQIQRRIATQERPTSNSPQPSDGKRSL